MRHMKCRLCGAGFLGAKSARFCPKCRAERQKLYNAQYYAAHKGEIKERYGAYLRQYYQTHKAALSAKKKARKLKRAASAQSAQEEALVSPCKNYRPDAVSCILCAGNSEEKFRACFKRVEK